MTMNDEPINLLDEDVIPRSRSAQAAQTETRHMNQRLATLGEPQAVTALAVQEGLQDFGIETDLTAEELFDVGVQSTSASLYLAIKAGVAFSASQQALKLTDSDMSESGLNPTFKDWIKSRGLTEQRVYEAISLAKGYLAIPAEQRRSYLALGKYKALKLASIEPEALAELAEKSPDAIGELALMSRSDMSKQMANLRAQLEIEQARNKHLMDVAHKPRLTAFAPYTEELRAECVALQTEAELPINSLRKLFEEVNAQDNQFNGGGVELKEWPLQMEQVWVTAHIVAARALELLELMRTTAQMDLERLPKRVMGQHILTPAEAERWLLDAPMIVNKHEAAKAMRQAERDEAKPKGRGRPNGSRNKAAAE